MVAQPTIVANSTDSNTVTYTANLSGFKEEFTEQEFESALQRYYSLMQKPYTTAEEDYELALFKDENLFLHATRITELVYKENKTAQEVRELKLLMDVETRPYVKRILALEAKQDRSKYETHELNCLLDPIIRSHTKSIMHLINKDHLSDKDHRKKFLLTNVYSISKAEEIHHLESYHKLSRDELETLSSDYLRKIAKIHPLSNINFQKVDYKPTAYYSSPDCIVNDARGKSYSAEEVKFATIKTQFNLAAKNLVENSFRQTMHGNSTLINNSLFSAPVQGFLKEREAALALVLEKVFFDNNVEFSQPALKLLTDHLNSLISQKKLLIKNADFKQLDKLIGDCIKEYPQLSDKKENVNKRPRLG